MDLGVPSEREKSFAEFLRAKEASEIFEEKQRRKETEKQQLTTQIFELREENSKLKNHKNILEKAVLTRQKTIDELQEKIEQLKTQLNHNDFMTNKILYIPDGIFLESATRALNGSMICLSFYVNTKDTDIGEFLEQIYDIIEREKVEHV